MKVISCLRFDTKQIMAARKGALSQLRFPTRVYDEKAHAGKLSLWARANVGDVFWIGEIAVWWSSGGSSTQHQLQFPADHGNDGRVRCPTWMAARHNVKRHEYKPDKLPRAYSKRCIEVTAKRVADVREITAEDAHASGAEMFIGFDRRSHYRILQDERIRENEPEQAYLAWWKKTYGAFDPERGKQIVILDFRLIEENADEYAARMNAESGALAVANEAIGERAA